MFFLHRSVVTISKTAKAIQIFPPIRRKAYPADPRASDLNG
jgi:hypothetical protein